MFNMQDVINLERVSGTSRDSALSESVLEQKKSLGEDTKISLFVLAGDLEDVYTIGPRKRL